MTDERSATRAIWLSPRPVSLERSRSTVARVDCAIIARLIWASSGSASVRTPFGVTPLTLMKHRSAKWLATLRAAIGPTNEPPIRRSVPPMPMSSRSGPPALQDKVHQRDVVRQDRRRQADLDDALGNVEARRRRVSEQ